MDDKLTQVGLTDQEIQLIGRLRYKQKVMKQLLIRMYLATVILVMSTVLLIAFYPNWCIAVLIFLLPFLVIIWQYDKREKMAGLEFLHQVKN